MKNNRRISNAGFLSLALFAFISALLAHALEEKNSIEEVLAIRRTVLSCGSSLTRNLSIQSQLSTLRSYPEVQILSNGHAGYGNRGDQNSCPHQLSQSTLWISNERKYKLNSCGRQYHA